MRWITGVAALLFACAVLSSDVAATPAGDGDYVFVKDTNRWVLVLKDGWYLSGRLDDEGNFIETGERIPSAGSPLHGPFHIINEFCTRSKKAYELRFGRLIRGEIDARGNFIPEAGSKVILFTDYRYSSGDPPIWNLPGRFVKKSELSREAGPKDGDR